MQHDVLATVILCSFRVCSFSIGCCACELDLAWSFYVICVTLFRCACTASPAPGMFGNLSRSCHEHDPCEAEARLCDTLAAQRSSIGYTVHDRLLPLIDVVSTDDPTGQYAQ